MVRDLAMPVHLIDHPTVREPDELAMSSRNVYLSTEARRRALGLSRALYAARDLLRAGERDLQVLDRQMRAEMTVVDTLEYVAIRSLPELSVPDQAEGRLLLAVAARVDSTRLIDNLVLQVDADDVREASLLDFLEAST
jgi:pantoate--beta-alanine ligase